MGRKKNQHWVPQHHLRLFSGGRDYVHVATRDGSRIAHFASVKGQCSRHRLYGSDEVEDWLKAFEDRHSRLYRAVLDLARGNRRKRLTGTEQHCLREALLLQRNRTPQRARLLRASTDQMLAFAFEEYLASLPSTPERRAMQLAIEQGRMSLRDSELASLLRLLTFAAVATPLLADLALCVVRNQTTVPFVMSDTPCVFSNHYMRDVKDMGVLGLVIRGLTVVMPIDSRTQVLLLDPTVYRMQGLHARFVDITEIADIDVLNSLQVHAAEECIYFADEKADDYVRDLLARRPRDETDRARFEVLRPLNAPNEEDQRIELLLTFELQLPVTLDLSLVRTEKLPAQTRIAAPRNPALVRRLKKSFMSSAALPPDIREVIRLAEPEFVIR